MRRVQAGEVDAFEALVDRHQDRIRRLVARNVPRTEVGEVAHDAFVAAYLSLGSYVPSHPFEHWLARVALRCCADHWRARGRAPLAARPVDLELPAAEAGTEAEDRELCEWVLAHLECEDREVLSLVHFQELSVKECARVLAWSESKVKVRAHRARLHLRRLLGRVLGEQERQP